MTRLLRMVGIGLLAMLAVFALAFAVVGVEINRLGSQDQAQPADAIVILGARINADGSPSSDLLSRTFHGMDLYQSGLAPWVICAGGSGGDRLAAGAVACRFAVEQLGLPAERALVVQDRDAYDTAAEAAAVAELMRQNGLHSAILVSHPLHLFRARWLFRREGLDVSTSPTNTDLGRIAPPLRLWYTVREAGGVLFTALRDWWRADVSAVEKRA